MKALHYIQSKGGAGAQVKARFPAPLESCVCQIIRIYHECEGRTEKSVTRIAVWHHEACRVMKNGDPEGRVFLSFPHTNNGFSFLFTTVFICLFIYSPCSIRVG